MANGTFYKKTSPSDSLTRLLETWSKIDDRRTLKENREKTQLATNLTQIDALTDISQDSSSINYLVSLLSESSDKYNQYEETALASQAVQQKISNKKAAFDDYKFQMNKAKKMYFGNPVEGVKGFSQVSGDDITNNWTYEFISNQLNEIDDFQASLYQDFEKQNPVNFRYNPGGVTDKQLIDRMGDFRGQLMAGLEALRGDGKITDNELFYVLTHDKDGLIVARTDNMRASSTQINKLNTAIGTIKKNIASLQSYQVKQGMKEEERGFIGVNIAALADSGVNLIDQWKEQYQADPKDMDWASYQSMKEEEQFKLTPAGLINQWDNEIKHLMYQRRLSEMNYRKWSGFAWEQGADTLGASVQSEFEKMISGSTESDILKFEVTDPSQVPLDLEFDIETGLYYSPEEEKYYTVESVEKYL